MSCTSRLAGAMCSLVAAVGRRALKRLGLDHVCRPPLQLEEGQRWLGLSDLHPSGCEALHRQARDHERPCRWEGRGHDL